MIYYLFVDKSDDATISSSSYYCCTRPGAEHETPLGFCTSAAIVLSSFDAAAALRVNEFHHH